ncbi:MAG: YbaK/EbsC family protein [bacterium]|nr:YbaK/EbsC family protein [bacterium]
MAILKNLEKLLKNAKVKYELIKHKTVYTALDKANTLKIKPKEVAKTVALKLGAGKFAQYVIASIPADKNFDKEKFKKLYNDWLKKTAKTEKKVFKAVKEIDFAAEAIIKKNIIKIKKGGTVPPFGSLFKLPAFIDRSLLKVKKLVINAGGFEESIRIAGSQIEKIENMIKGSFSKTKK